MDESRRVALKSSGMAAVLALFAGTGVLVPAAAYAQDWNSGAFQGKNLQEVLKALGATGVTETRDVNWGSTPEIAENGAVVPISVTSTVPGTEWIAVLIAKNPNTLAAAFDIPSGTDPSISTRVKMGQSSDVHALVRAGGKYYIATREVKVTLGGCGG